MRFSEDTIAAQATAVGQGAIAVIRMSGPDCLNILQKCTSEKTRRRLKPRYAVLAELTDENGDRIDQVLLTYFPGPASYTGEDVAEISCHGGMLVTGRLLERLFRCGARAAEPGEFTRRAFLNGRMDLTQAEAVMDIISAGSDMALKAAQAQLHGAIGEKVNAVRESLIHVLAHIEAYIDFPDEDISPDTVDSLMLKLREAEGDLTRLLATADGGRLLREGIRTAIVGAPNAGKSSLLNTLLGYERAIVSNIAGTTRDTVEERILISGLALRLIDTAGLRVSDDVIEQAGILRTNEAIRSADLILEVVDSSQPIPEKQVIADGVTPHLLILNKADLPADPAWESCRGIRFSCATGKGRSELEAAILSLFASKLPSEQNAHVAAINARHQQALNLCRDRIGAALDSLAAGDSPEFTSLELREALLYLSEITGAVDTEDILDAVFSSFCLGK